MLILFRTIRWMVLLALLFCIHVVPLAAQGAANGHKQVAKYNVTPFSSHYLYPGGEVVMSMDSLPEERIMALTFDDGPDDRDLEIAALLKQHDIPAAFFYIGNKVRARPEIVKEIRAGQYEIGYHSYRHQKMNWSGTSGLLDDFRKGHSVMQSLGVPLTWFRPPYGDFNSNVVRVAKQQGMETVLWTIDSRDWTGVSASTMAQRVIRQFHPGAILLFHSTHDNTLKALPEIIAAAKKENFRFVSLWDWRHTIQLANCRISGRACPSAPEMVASAKIPDESSSKKMTELANRKSRSAPPRETHKESDVKTQPVVPEQKTDSFDHDQAPPHDENALTTVVSTSDTESHALDGIEENSRAVKEYIEEPDLGSGPGLEPD
ncbi:MAG: polysaccharide deacetylase family protein [Magnetococcus sp. YQC-5]